MDEIRRRGHELERNLARARAATDEAWGRLRGVRDTGLALAAAARAAGQPRPAWEVTALESVDAVAEASWQAARKAESAAEAALNEHDDAVIR